jgi:hypothetical protein
MRWSMKRLLGKCLAVSVGLALGAFPDVTAAAAASDGGPRTFHLSPDGTADGSAPDRAARFDDPALWQRAKAALADGPVDVVLADGTYLTRPTLRVVAIGHEEHRLTIRGASPTGAIVRESPDDTAERNPLVRIGRCANLTVRHLNFTGPERCGMGIFVNDSSRVLIERCTWRDFTGTYYSGVSVTGDKAVDVVIRDCHFERVGFDGHAHMIYTAYGTNLVKYVNNTFIDCPGDFVRFRDRSECGVVWGNTFRSTGTYKGGANPPMVSIPLFNDEDPAKQTARPAYEYFGTNFLIANNKFIYDMPEDPAKHEDDDWVHHQWPVMFHHSGFSPPGRQHLLSEAEAQLIRDGPADERRRLLVHHVGIDPGRVHMFGNEYQNTTGRVVLRSHPNYGAKSRGFVGVVEIGDLVSVAPVVTDVEEAMTFFESGRSFESTRPLDE